MPSITDIDSTSASSSSAALSGVNSLLSCLHRPTSSELSRKRKVDRNPPAKGKKRSRGTSTSDPKSVTPSQSVKQYTGENLTVSNSNKKLFCLVCKQCILYNKTIHSNTMNCFIVQYTLFTNKTEQLFIHECKAT